VQKIPTYVDLDRSDRVGGVAKPRTINPPIASLRLSRQSRPVRVYVRIVLKTPNLASCRKSAPSLDKPDLTLNEREARLADLLPVSWTGG
jgi:hypothetical protein